MTETTEPINVLSDADEEEDSLWDLELDRCEITMRVTMNNVGTLAGAHDAFAQTVGVNGIGSFHLLISDPDTGDEFIVMGNLIRRLEDVVDQTRRDAREMADEEARESIDLPPWEPEGDNAKVTQAQLNEAREAMNRTRVVALEAATEARRTQREYTQASLRYDELLAIAQGQETLPFGET